MSDRIVPEEFDPVRILQTLAEHDVRFVVVGGIAATLHGSPLATRDIDIAVEQSADNLDHLAGGPAGSGCSA